MGLKDNYTYTYTTNVNDWGKSVGDTWTTSGKDGIEVYNDTYTVTSITEKSVSCYIDCDYLDDYAEGMTIIGAENSSHNFPGFFEIEIVNECDAYGSEYLFWEEYVVNDTNFFTDYEWYCNCEGDCTCYDEEI